MLEREMPRHKQATSDLFTVGIVAASLLGAHGKVEAADIQPEATWTQAVQELRRSVLEEPVEFAAAGAELRSGKMVWPRTIRGEADGVRADFRQMMRQLATNIQGEPVRNFCDIHTHQTASTASEFDIPSGAERAYVPPSLGDTFVVTRGGRQEMIPEYAEAEFGMHIEHVTTAVFDPRGVWYYRTLNDEERQRYETDPRGMVTNRKTFIPEIQEPFVRSSVLSNFDFKVEYEKLRTAYRQKIGTEIRFVTYEDLGNEPPCAGPDYVPEKK